MKQLDEKYEIFEGFRADFTRDKIHLLNKVVNNRCFIADKFIGGKAQLIDKEVKSK